MPFQRKWLQATDVMIEPATGALLVQATISSAQRSFDLLRFPIYHVEGIEAVTWDMQYAMHELTDTAFAAPILIGDTSVAFEGLFARIDYRGVPGQITPLTAGGIATLLSEIDEQLRSGDLLVPLDEAALGQFVPGRRYIRRSRQKARGHDEWSVFHDQIITW